MDRLTAYQTLNKTFHKKYIFNFGSEAGFYSEFNNMVFGIIYCLKYEYQFIMYSGNSKFKVNKGWEDYFEPFCSSVNSSFHKRFNKRLEAPKIKLKRYHKWLLFKLFNKDTYLTYQLFYSFYNKDFEKEQFDFPQLGLKGNLRDVSAGIVEMIYRFNQETKTAVEALIATANLPAKYASINIRRGDKSTEWKFMPMSAYINELHKHTDLKDVFVFSDDYTVVEDLEKAYPNIRFYTLVGKDERGYVHKDFIKESAFKKRHDLVKVFASLEIMKASELAIGTYTTNPGIFLGMSMPEEKFISVQKKSWYPFEEDDVKNDIVAQTKPR